MVLGSDVLVYNHTGYFPVFFAEYTANGSLDTAIFASSGSLSAEGLTLDETGNLYWTGTYAYQPLYIGNDSIPRQSTIGNLAVAKYNYAAITCTPPKTRVKTVSTPPYFELCPNPTSEGFTIALSANGSGASISVSDLTGRMMYQSITTSSSIKIETSGWAAGVYLCRVVWGDGTVVVKKVVVAK
jgi:Secretion system C-terminal sorting domain